MILVGEMGHQYEDLINGAIEVSYRLEQEDLLLSAITKQILSSNDEEDEEDNLDLN